MIRIAHTNVAVAVAFMQRFMQESPVYSQYPCDPEYVQDQLSTMLSSGRGIALMDDAENPHGIMLGVVTQPWFSPLPIASEMILYVEPAFRGTSLAPRLVNTFCTDAADKGAEWVLAGSSAGINDAGVLRLYERLGFEPFGLGMRKKLCAPDLK